MFIGIKIHKLTDLQKGKIGINNYCVKTKKLIYIYDKLQEI